MRGRYVQRPICPGSGARVHKSECLRGVGRGLLRAGGAEQEVVDDVVAVEQVHLAEQ